VANSRASLRRQQYGEIMASQTPRNNFREDRDFYARHPSMEFSIAARSDPATPPEIPASDVLFGNTMQGDQGLGSGFGQGYYFGPGQAQHRHLHQVHAHSHPGPNAYRLEDVTSMYEAPPIPQSSEPSDPSQLAAHLPAAFSNLFTDDIEGSALGPSAHVGNLNYGWSDGSHFHS
jgi:hypothetical protein